MILLESYLSINTWTYLINGLLDKTVTSGLGLRWAFSGPIMTNVLGGGGDFGYFMDHLGPALKTWLDDMQQNQFKMDPSEKQTETLKDNVNQWVANVDLDRVERDRDAFLAGFIKARSLAE